MRIQSIEKLRKEERSGESGFTMIEMTVAMVVFAIVLGSIYGLLEVGRSARFNTMESNEASQDVRIGLNRIGIDVLNAGVDYPSSGSVMRTNWLTTNLSVATGAANLTPVIPGFQINTLINTRTGTTARTDQITLTSTDNAFNRVGGVSTPLRVVSANPAIGWLTCQNANDANSCNLGDLMCVNSGNCGFCGNGVLALVTGRATNVRSNDTVVAAASDPMGINDWTPAPPSNLVQVLTPTPAGAYRISMVTYYVLDDGSGQGTGTFMRRTWGGVDSSGNVVRFTDQPLAFDVTAMTIQYFMQDGTSTANPALSNFHNVRQISVTITVRSPRTDPKTGLNYIDTLTAVFNTRNLGFETNG